MLEITDDHIIAGAWFPDTTPATVQRWTAPACRSCNNSFSSLERYVHARLAACIDPTHPAAAEMWDKAKSSIDPRRARSHRDREHRTRQRDAFWKNLRALAEPPAHTLPFSVSNFTKGSRTGLMIEAPKLDALCKKWGRGLYYKIHGIPVSASAEIEIIHPSEGATHNAFGRFWDQRTIIDAGPGIQVSYLSAEEGNKRADVYLFTIWNQFEVFVYVADCIADDVFDCY